MPYHITVYNITARQAIEISIQTASRNTLTINFTVISPGNTYFTIYQDDTFLDIGFTNINQGGNDYPTYIVQLTRHAYGIILNRALVENLTRQHPQRITLFHSNIDNYQP